MTRNSVALIAFCLVVSSPGAFGAGPQAGDFFVRVRPMNVDPRNNDKDTVRINGQNVPNGEVRVDDRWTLGIDVDYMITRNLALDIQLDTTSKHEVEGAGSLSGLGKILDARVLPPAAILNYHFFADKRYRPYLGAGIGYAFFFDEDVKGSLEDVIGDARLDMEDTVFYVAQAGIDVDLTDRWFINAVFKATRMESRAKVDSNDGTTKLRVDVNIDPFIYGIGVGYRF